VSRCAYPDNSGDDKDALEVFQLSLSGAGSADRTRDRQSSPRCGSNDEGCGSALRPGQDREMRLASASRLPMRRQPAMSLRSRSSGSRASSVAKRSAVPRSASSRPVHAGERVERCPITRCRLAVSTLTILRRRDGRRLELRGTPATFRSVTLYPI